jgi:hypothetical protein
LHFNKKLSQHITLTRVIVDKKIQTYRDLEIWNKGIGIVKDISVITELFPKNEFYGIINQMRRCAVSIHSNIAEGFRRYHNKEISNFCIYHWEVVQNWKHKLR